jgi:hypothetical protein
MPHKVLMVVSPRCWPDRRLVSYDTPPCNVYPLRMLPLVTDGMVPAPPPLVDRPPLPLFHLIQQRSITLEAAMTMWLWTESFPVRRRRN